LMPGSSVASPRKCSVCNVGCGIMVTCSSQRCKTPLLHPECAGQITFSKKNACKFWRCPSCVRPVPAAKPKPKRSSRRVKQPLKKQNHDSSNGGASKNDDAAAGTSKGSASEGSASDGSASEGSASDVSMIHLSSDSETFGAFDHSTSSNRVDQGPESPGCSMSEPRSDSINLNVCSELMLPELGLLSHLDEKPSHVSSEMQDESRHHDGSALSLESACNFVTSNGCISDVSSDLGEGQIEGLFNICVHNTLLGDSCGLVSLLEAAKCLDTSYGLIFPDDAASLRTAIVDFIAKHLDTCCEGECSGISRTWREKIALQYFPEKQVPVRYLLNIHAGTEQEEEVVIENMNDYLEAMAMPRTQIDDIALLALARMWDVRLVMFWREANRWTSDKSQYMPEKYLDAKKSIYLVWTPPHIKWAHADGQECEVASCRESGTRISAHHKFLNYEESALYSAMGLKALPSTALTKGKHCDPDQPFEELSNPAALHEGMQAGHEAVKLNGNVAYSRIILDAIMSGLSGLSNLVRGIHSAYQVSLIADCSSIYVTENAIRVLVALDNGLHLSSLQMEQWYEILRSRGRMLSRKYRENDFNVMVDETIGLLNQYSGRQILDDRDLTPFHEHLKTYGWVLSPRMWTREEIAVMCVILLDPELMFINILQKNVSDDEEKYQNRGMACLDPRVQAIMYSRLKQYKFVLEDSHLPIDIPAGVVLNSGGSYLQRFTWEYSDNGRFVVDDSVNAMLFEVIQAPAYTCCDGVYIATTTRRLNGQPVYVGISPTQFFGVRTTDEQGWDSVSMNNELSPNHVLREYFVQKSCEGKTFAAERVLYWENGQAVFQSVTAYGTDMILMTMDCETLCSHCTGNWSRIENFDFKNKKSIMVAGLAKQRPVISSIQVRGTITPNYKFACGTERILVRVKKTISENKPYPTKKQIIHKDGPTLYDGKQFDERGNIVANAGNYTERRIPLPPGISISALFAFFCRTFLGINPIAAVRSKDHKRSCNSEPVSLRLHANIGRAVIFNFDTDHQVWRHE
jgi:hypothetical protein